MTPIETKDPRQETAAAGTTVGRARTAALEPYVTRLRDAHAEYSATPVAIPTEAGDLMLEPWESDVLRRFPDGTDAGGHPWPTLVLEGLAFRVLCLNRCDGEREGEADSEVEIIGGAAAGVTLLDDLHEANEQFLKAGRMKDVKHLSDLRNHVRQGVTEMRRLLGEQSRDAFTSAVAAFRTEGSLPALGTEEPGPDSTGKRRAPVQFRKEPSPVRIAYASKPTRTMLVPLLSILAISVLAWVLVFSLQQEEAPPPELTLENFKHLEAVRSIEARPPSLFVRIDLDDWKAVPAPDRLRLVGEIAAVAERAGYVGVQLWTDDGVPVGRWSQRKGAQLIERTAAAS